ncbi:hypothetical protein CHLNCDRAFT_143149 [Chlorella variabilis]|uniref:LYR motif-containing protein 9 n=1 Tax=Chlorella variabilis TaxID=554065 RepID=E1Z9K7_CHLVA|nr:hypothetical protein CHLNCDRAFT_143149 [Chlorella variabilis]EFN57795.1 hypothetical protein CHLNCDRAFT_143149 [Chlorella variabilis]|eukprot:XP_005849897.1 hypothetical protein CHLNCDRAFT_143149 [Chlorella variabilis]
MTAGQARALYRQLFRKTRDLPRQAQHYYRNSIRSGFVAHSDEDDPEVLQRIYEQSLRDADWILDKYKSQQPQHK